MSYSLTDRANFPDTDLKAARNVQIAQSIIFDFFDVIIRNTLDGEALELWNIARGLNEGAGVYYDKADI